MKFAGPVSQFVFCPVRTARWVSSEVSGLMFLLEPGDSILFASSQFIKAVYFIFFKQLCNYSSGREVLSAWDFNPHLLSD